MEIADIFVINKADRSGADRLFQEINIMLDIALAPKVGWRPPVNKVGSIHDEKNFVIAIGELVAKVIEHRNFMAESGLLEERKRRKAVCELRGALDAGIMEPIYRELINDGVLEQMIEKLITRENDPHTLAEEVARKYLKNRS